MNPSVELILVLLIVGASVVALMRRFYLFIKHSGESHTACGSSCGGCAARADEMKSTLNSLVQLDLNADKR